MANKRRRGAPEVPPHLVEVARDYGERLAELTAAWLDLHGEPCGENCPNETSAYLLELGAVLQLRLWEDAGLSNQLPAELPSFNDLKEACKSRARLGTKKFGPGKRTSLSQRVFLVWWQHFAWSAPELLHAEVVLGQIDEQETIQQLARFFWETRHIGNEGEAYGKNQ